MRIWRQGFGRIQEESGKINTLAYVNLFASSSDLARQKQQIYKYAHHFVMAIVYIDMVTGLIYDLICHWDWTPCLETGIYVTLVIRLNNRKQLINTNRISRKDIQDYTTVSLVV